MRAEDSGRKPDLPWGELIRSEMDSWQPERLPASFRPRARELRPAARQAWRPVRVMVLVAILGFLAVSLASASPRLPALVRELVSTTRSTPAAAPLPPGPGTGHASPHAAPSPGSSRPTPGPSTRQRPGGTVTTPRAPEDSPSSQPSGSPLTVLPSLTPTPVGTPAPTPMTPKSTPEPTPLCIAGILCV